MTLKFPHYPDVPLNKSPLTEVVCQIRIPTILRIANEAPVEFQERVRRRFPRFEPDDAGFSFQFSMSDAGIAVPPSFPSNPRLFRFQTNDRSSFISLASDFYALSTTRYTVWDDFARDLELAHLAVRDTYDPSFATRIGLRYINHIRPPQFGFSSIDEAIEIFRSDLTSLLQVDVWDTPIEMFSQLLLNDDEGHLGLRFGITRPEGEAQMVLDLDYFDDRELGFDSLIKRCREYHDIIYAAFRWCIKDDQLHVFDPATEQGGQL